MKEILLPASVQKMLEKGSVLAANVSGGKDSSALVEALSPARESAGWKGEYFAIHADLGRAEWTESLPQCQRLARHHQIPLQVVRRKQGDLMQSIYDRAARTQGAVPFWPSPTARYCTSYHKRDQFDIFIRNTYPDLVISAEGVRAEESPKRSKLPVVEIRTTATAKRYWDMTVEEAVDAWKPGQGRLALTWRPIHQWQLADVWESLGYSLEELNERQILYPSDPRKALYAWSEHPAYVYGNERVSCVFCIMASQNDLLVGKKHRPELWEEYVRLETQWGYSFAHQRWLRDLSCREKTCPSTLPTRLHPTQLALFDCAMH